MVSINAGGNLQMGIVHQLVPLLKSEGIHAKQFGLDEVDCHDAVGEREAGIMIGIGMVARCDESRQIWKFTFNEYADADGQLWVAASKERIQCCVDAIAEGVTIGI